MIIKAIAIAAAGIVAALAIVACGGSPGPSSYLATGGSYVDFIQWEPTTGSDVQGTLTKASVSGTAPQETISADRYPFTGTINGSSVTFTFSGLLTSATIYGTLNGGTLTLQVPQSNGTIQPGTLAQSDTGAYNSAVAALNRRISHANALAAAAQAQAQQQQQNAQAEQAEQDDVSTLQQDASMASGSNLAGDLSDFAADVQTASSDLATEKQDTAGDNSYCGATQMVAGDAQLVDGDLQLVQGDVQSLTPDLATIRQDIAQVQSDAQSLTSSGLPPPSGPTATAATSAARSSIQQAITRANGYIDQVNALDARAYSIANGMVTGSCSGDGPGSPTSPIQHIR